MTRRVNTSANEISLLTEARSAVVLQYSGFALRSDATAPHFHPIDTRDRALAFLHFFCFNAHRVFIRFHFTPRSSGIHLSKLSAEQQDL